VRTLIFRDLLSNFRLWCGSFLVVIASAAILGAVATFLTTAVSAYSIGEIDDSDFEGLIGFVTMPAVLGSITTVIVLVSVSSLTVSLQRRNYALWQVVGVSPDQITRVILIQLAILGCVGAGCGIFLGWLVTPFLFHGLAHREPTLRGAEVQLGFVGISVVLVTTIALALLGGLRAARKASAVAPVEALREQETVRARVSAVRWVSIITATGISIALGIALHSVPVAGIGSNGLTLGLFITVAIAAAAPLVVPSVVRCWTALIRPTWSVTWHLARKVCLSRVRQTTTTVTPVMVGTGLVTTYSGVFATFQSALHTSGLSGTEQDVWSTVAVFGAPLILAGIAAAATIFMSNDVRAREYAFLRAVGMAPSAILITAAFEVIIYATTALLLGLFVGGITTSVTWLAFRATAPTTVFTLDPTLTLTVAATALAAMCTTALIPAAGGSRSHTQTILEIR